MSSFRRYAKYLVNCPKLYRIYSPQHQTQPTTPRYTPTFLESVTDATITYILPFTFILSIYQRKFSYFQLTVLVYIASRLLRSISRLTNPEYLNFLDVLEQANESKDAESLRTLRSYDFEFKYFPVLHHCNVSVGDYVAKQRVSNGLMWYASWVVAHSFGIRLIYPGLILGGILRAVLEDGRSKLVVEKGGERIKVRVGSGDGGEVDVDAMVFDRRGGGGKGDVLVLCCEGNAGFYEIGMLGGALSEGYSVLGWNHPGFGGSTGTPYPATELTASLGVMDYATNVLGFKESSIIVYGWSIGGFPATYIASKYPGIKGLLLDATFDNITPLAIPRMPEFMSPLVVATINDHVNLDNLENIREYKGPIRIVRRVDDEIISDPPGVLACNRGNYLLVEYVLGRYGKEVSEGAKHELVDWVNDPHDVDEFAVDCLSGEGVGGVKGVSVGGELVAMAASILRDYKSTHCTPLPREYYRIK